VYEVRGNENNNNNGGEEDIKGSTLRRKEKVSQKTVQ